VARRAGFFAVRDNSLASTYCLSLDTCGEVVTGGVETEVLLKLNVQDAVDKLPSRKRVHLG